MTCLSTLFLRTVLFWIPVSARICIASGTLSYGRGSEFRSKVTGVNLSGTTGRVARGLLLGVIMVAGPSAYGGIVIGFSQGDSFDGDVAGDPAGPFVDSVTGQDFTITTIGIGGGGSALNSTNGRLGIVGGSGTQANARFNTLESWTWDFGSVSIDLLGIDFGLFTAGETFRLESTAWAGATFDAPGSSVTFSSDSQSGFFTFADHGSTDQFSMVELSSSTMVSIDPGDHLVLTYTGNDPNGSVLEGMSVRARAIAVPQPNAVPEPSSLAIATLLTPMLSLIHRHRHRHRRTETHRRRTVAPRGAS